MNVMRRRSLGILLGLMLALGMALGMCRVAYADTDEGLSGLWVGDSAEVTSVGVISGTGGTGTASVALEHGLIILTLDNFSYTGAGHKWGGWSSSVNERALIYADREMRVILNGTNDLTYSSKEVSDSYGICSATYLWIDGSGSVAVQGANRSIAAGNLTIEGATVTGAGEYGIYGDDVTITGGDVTLRASMGAVNATNTIGVQGGTLQANGTYMAMSGRDVTFAGGNVTAISNAANSSAILATSNVKFEGGTVYVMGDAEGSCGVEVADSGCVTIKGKDVTVCGTTQAIRGTVKNSIAGTGWTNVEGTEGKTDLMVNEKGRTLDYKRLKFVGSASLPEESSEGAWTTIAGAGRYQTMANTVMASFSSSEWAVIASGEGFADALAASSLAGTMGCPIVTTASGSLTADASEVLKQLGVRHALVVGGKASVSDNVMAALSSMSIEATRVAGADRTATSLAVLSQVPVMGDASDTVIVATGASFADALSVGPLAYLTHAPIVLVSGGSLSEEALLAIRGGGFTKAVIVGGASSVSPKVETQLAGLEVTRLSGADRYETSAAIAAHAAGQGLGFANPVVASGSVFPDALVGAPYAARKGGVLLLVSEGSTVAEDLVHAHKSEFSSGTVLGGTSSVPKSLVERLEAAVR